jgi:hypothetical protein
VSYQAKIVADKYFIPDFHCILQLVAASLTCIQYTIKSIDKQIRVSVQVNTLYRITDNRKPTKSAQNQGWRLLPKKRAIATNVRANYAASETESLNDERVERQQ